MNKRNVLYSFLPTPTPREKSFKCIVLIVIAKEGSTIFLLKITRTFTCLLVGNTAAGLERPGEISYIKMKF